MLYINGATQKEVCVNDGGGDCDFRVESSSQTHVIFVEGSTETISFNGSTSLGTLTLYGHDSSDETMVIQAAASQSVDVFQITNSSTTQLFQILSDGSMISTVPTSAIADGSFENSNVSLFYHDTVDQVKVKLKDSGGTTSIQALPKVLSHQYSDTGNVGSGEDDLHSYTLPASALNNDGDFLEIELSFTIASNANAKTIKIYFGGTVIFNSNTDFGDSLSYNDSNAQELFVSFKVHKTGSSAQRIAGLATTIDTQNTYSGLSDACAAPIVTALTKTDTSTIVIKATGEGVSNDDVIQKTSLIIKHAHS